MSSAEPKRKKINWKNVRDVMGIILVILAFIGVIAVAVYLVPWLWGALCYVCGGIKWLTWDMIFAHTVGLPFFWLSSQTGATPLPPGTILLLYLLYCLDGFRKDGGLLIKTAGGYGLLFVAGLLFRFMG